MADRKAVRINVLPERKEEWEELAEKENRNLSDTIRKAMAEYKATVESSGGETAGLPESVEEEIYETGDTVELLHNQIEVMNQRFERIEEEMSANREVRAVANEVFEILPGKGNVGNPSELADGSVAFLGTIEWIADTLNETGEMVEQATDQLVADHRRVHEVVPDDEEPRYYKESR
ncbi:hypothetical protein SAMN05216388_10218 [Halorientalis persicus]|uniref:Ribbon-helix-helix protein, copG family n=1 Tax=Halorientalis persicus TaxID=1367881 RepID=A0A1H8T357_9EURY|nr:hypothetical protein [Halorientalis persicus]SEO85245.1 hypothetical protein SAMN05216388_10218 [Halorientalis persicus]